MFNAILLNTGETEGGRDLSIEQSNIAYADGVTLIRFIFFFVQGDIKDVAVKFCEYF